MRPNVATTLAVHGSIYNIMIGRLEEILNFLNTRPLRDFYKQEQSLMNMVSSLAEIGPAVEYYGDQRVPDGLTPDRCLAVGEVVSIGAGGQERE